MSKFKVGDVVKHNRIGLGGVVTTVFTSENWHYVYEVGGFKIEESELELVEEPKEKISCICDCLACYEGNCSECHGVKHQEPKTDDECASSVTPQSALNALVKDEENILKTEKKEWPCEHIVKSDYGPYSENFGYKGSDCKSNITFLHKSENFCKYCGAERPKEKETLEDVIERQLTMKEALQNFNDNKPTKYAVAKAIRAHLKGKEGEIASLFKTIYQSHKFHDDISIAQQILKVLGVE